MAGGRPHLQMARELGEPGTTRCLDVREPLSSSTLVRADYPPRRSKTAAGPDQMLEPAHLRLRYGARSYSTV
ncbi:MULTISPECIES: hypothetical protein [Streptomyces]|uniref:Uncharacterized protein n=1 Tax=Streptomyces indiaensis TaxID=284033 RepID=A0ABN3DFV5_9ACTN|nr:hypothetical protein [Streptomyces indiaensis]MCF1644540.1 hypothetical protein [Streptomyces indiaensis]